MKVSSKLVGYTLLTTMTIFFSQVSFGISSPVPSSTLPGTQVESGTVTGTQIAPGAITNTQIQSGTITGNNIASGAITSTQIAPGAITSTQIGSGAITGTQIQGGAIGSSQIVKNNTITGSSFGPQSVTANKLGFTPAVNVGLAITNSGSAAPGSSATYIATVTNSGAGALTNLTLTFNIPSTFTGITYTPSTGTYTSSSGSWTGLNLAAGQSIKLTLTGNVASSATGTLNIQGTVAVPSGFSNTSSTATASDSSSLTQDVNLGLSIATTTAPVPGQTATYTTTITNSGPGTLTSLTLPFTLPGTFTGVSYSANSGSYSSGNWTGLNLGPNKSIALTLTGTVSSSAGGASFPISATVSVPSGFINTNSTTTATNSTTLCSTSWSTSSPIITTSWGTSTSLGFASYPIAIAAIPTNLCPGSYTLTIVLNFMLTSVYVADSPTLASLYGALATSAYSIYTNNTSSVPNSGLNIMLLDPTGMFFISSTFNMSSFPLSCTNTNMQTATLVSSNVSSPPGQIYVFFYQPEDYFYISSATFTLQHN